MTTERFPELPDDLRARATAVATAAVPEILSRAGEWEFSTWDCSVPAPGGLGVDELDWQRLARSELRAQLRDALGAAWTARELAHVRPDMMVTVFGTDEGASVRFVPSTAFVAGRYRKLVRGLSQTVFHCRRCRGRGTRRGVPCPGCTGSGRKVPESVEEFIAPLLADALGGSSAAFHGSGREDVDVRMLGEGRPFAVSIETPRRRAGDWDALSAAVAAASGGRVEVAGLRSVGRAEVRRITVEHGEKTYRVVVENADSAPLPADAADRALAFAGVELEQRTPQRVSRRADLVRRRVVRGVRVTESAPTRLVLEIRTDPGLYVKELVSGDEGRTTPSLAAAFGVTCVCTELDVLAVGGVPEDTGGASGPRRSV